MALGDSTGVRGWWNNLAGEVHARSAWSCRASWWHVCRHIVGINVESKETKRRAAILVAFTQQLSSSLPEEAFKGLPLRQVGITRQVATWCLGREGALRSKNLATGVRDQKNKPKRGNPGLKKCMVSREA